MRTYYRVAAMVMVVILLAIPLGCKPKGVAATVNGEKIYVDEVQKQLDGVESQHAGAFEGEQGEAMKKEFTQRIIDNLVIEKLLLAEAKKKKITASKAEIDAKREQVKAMFATEEEFKDAVKNEGFDEKGLTANLEKQIIMEKISKEITKGVKVTDKQVKAEYDKNKAQYLTEEAIEASHILVDSEESAKKLKEQLDDGADFAELAKQNSKDEGSKAQGGALGEFKKGQMVKEFEEAAFVMKVGDVSDPIKSQFGYHIIKVTKKIPPKQKTFEEVKKEVSDQVKNTLAGEKFKAYTNKLKEKATIEIKLVI